MIPRRRQKCMIPKALRLLDERQGKDLYLDAGYVGQEEICKTA